MKKIEVIYWGNEDWCSDNMQLAYKDRVSDIYMKNILKQYKGKLPDIHTIEIETVNRCNNDCAFCPVSVGNEKREYQCMEEDLFYRIIDELEENKYSGHLSLFSNNEPLLDKRIFTFLEYAKKHLPNAKHAMYTNGKLLTVEKLNLLVKYLDYLVIDNYNDELKLNENIVQLVEMGLPEGTKCKVRVEVRKKNQVLSSRGGAAPNKQNDQTFSSSCILPFCQMVIRPDGRVSKCCQDAYGCMSLADVSKEGVFQAWNSASYNAMRSLFVEKGREFVKNCSTCDLFGLSNYFPLAWMEQYTNAFISCVCEHKKNQEEIVFVGNPDGADELNRMLSFFGCRIEKVLETIESIQNNYFYIMDHYNWEEICKLSLEDVGRRFIVYENPNGFLLQRDDKINFAVDVREIFSKILKAEYDDNLWIFGAGKNALLLHEKYHFKPKGYLDNNRKRIGEVFLRKMIAPLEKIDSMESIILVSANAFDDIQKQLLQLGIRKENIVDGNRLL